MTHRPTPRQRQAPGPPRITPASVQAEVLANIKGQRLGPATVADLGLPEVFLTRVAGRIMQTWYHERFRIVVDDTGRGAEPPTPVGDGGPRASNPGLSILQVKCPALPVSGGAPAAPPPARNFRLSERGVTDPPLDMATSARLAPFPELAPLVATRLAEDGLLLCAAKALVLIRQNVTAAPAEAEVLLRSAGFPTDLLASFSPDSVEGARGVLGWIDAQLVKAAPERLRNLFDRVPFRWTRTSPGFAALPDSGQVEPGVVRIQLTRGGYYAGPGDGGSLDLTRQLLEATRAHLLIQAEEKHVPGLMREAAGWPAGWRDRLAVIAQDLPLSQWAQDSGKAGRGPDGVSLTLLPRFASRGEETSQFVAGDSCIGVGLTASGRRVAQSPLLFQGGNMLVVEEPDGRRTMLVGEAEVHRNQSLGLAADQALAALGAELGVDRCVVLPAASIHLDYEVSVRTHGNEVIAFVNDTQAATQVMLEIGLAILREAGTLTARQFAAAIELVHAGSARELQAKVWPLISAGVPGQFQLSLAERFRKGEADSGVGSFLRFLGALDCFTANSPAALAALSDPYQVAYLLAIARQERDRAAIRRQLADLGWRVVQVPSLALGNRSVNALNGLHVPNAYLMPVYGGIYAPLDDAAARAVSAALGPEVAVIKLTSGESQRRDGALHCSVSVLAGP